MPIVEEYDAIAKRLRELTANNPQRVNEISNLERWRNLAKETAHAYVKTRRRHIVGRPILPRRV